MSQETPAHIIYTKLCDIQAGCSGESVAGVRSCTPRAPALNYVRMPGDTYVRGCMLALLGR